MEVNLQSLIFELFGGLGIFLFSIKIMGDGLKKFSGDKIRIWIEKFTNTPIKAVIVGIFVTGVIQSSSGTTALAISLVRANLMTLKQAIGIIMGVNIGTTITAFLIGLKISEYALVIIAIGGLLYMFVKNKKIKYLAQAIFGFGGLFLGLEIMSKGLLPLASIPAFSQFMVDLSFNPLLAILVGTVLTMVVQSSSATIGILQSLYGGGVISLPAALPILYGDNIGTTITSILASIGGTTAAKRTAAAHVVFNVLGSVVFTLLLIPYYHFVSAAANVLRLTPEMQIAFAHAGFNLTMTILLLPFTNLIARIVTKVIKSKKGEVKLPDLGEMHIDAKLIEQSSSFALLQVRKKVVSMAQFTRQALIKTLDFSITSRFNDLEQVYQIEAITDALNKELTHSLVEIGMVVITEEEVFLQNSLLNAVRDLELISDYTLNIAEQFEKKIHNSEQLSCSGFAHYVLIMKSVINMVDLLVLSIETNNQETDINQIIMQKVQLDKITYLAQEHYINRLTSKNKNQIETFIFTDVMSNIQQINTHIINIIQRNYE